MATTSTVWPILHYADPDRARRFLVDVVGFGEVVVGRDDGGDIVHVELCWPGGGVLVFGSTKHDEGVHRGLRSGGSATYVVAEDPDLVHERAVAYGAEVVEPPHDTTFGSGVRARAFTLQDPEGNLWTFGSYAGPGTVGP